MTRALLLLLLAGCASTTPDVVSVRWIRVAQADVHRVCAKEHGPGAIVVGRYRACSSWNRDAKACTVWAPDFSDVRERELMASLGHELKHCFDGGWH